MPKIINAYASDNTLAKAFGDLANSMFGDQSKNALIRTKAQGEMRAFENLPLLADALVSGDHAAAVRAGLLSGTGAKDAAGYGQYYDVNKYGHDSRRGTNATMAVPGANFGNTSQGTREEFANKRAISAASDATALNAARYKVDNAPTNVVDPTTGMPIIRRQTEAYGARPVVSQPEMRGTVLGNMLPELSREERVAAAGAEPKNVGTIYNYTGPDGTRGRTTDGRVDVATGAPVHPQAQLYKIEGADLSAGATGDEKLDREFLAAETSVRQMEAKIDNMVADLSKPNADMTIGVLGKGARIYNDLRAQSAAVVRALGGETPEQAFASPENRAALTQVTQAIFGDQNLNARAQQLGVDASVLQARIEDLAYAIAKAREPGGRLGVDDIKRAANTIGATLMDPTAMTSVLTSLRRDVRQGHEIYKGVLKDRYPNFRAPDAPAAATAPTQRWERGPDGLPRRVQ